MQPTSPAVAEQSTAAPVTLTMEILDVGYSPDPEPRPAVGSRPSRRGVTATLIVILLIVAGVFLLVSPGGDEPDGGSTGAAPGAAGAAAIPEALRFTGTTLDGTTIDAASLAGKPTVLWFWAPWCATCASQASAVADAATEYRGRVNFLGIAGLDDSTEAMRRFVNELEVGNVQHLDDKAGAVWRKFRITEQSTYVMLDSSGAVVQSGWLDDVTFTEWLQRLAT